MTPGGPQESQNDPAQERAPGVRPASRVLRYLLAAAIPAALLVFIGRTMWLQWDTVSAHAWSLDYRWLILSAIAFYIDFIILIQLWRILLFNISHQPLPLLTAYRILALSNLGKYVPGKVWAVMGIVYFLKREGYTATAAIASTGLHQAYTVVAGLLFASAVLGAELWGRLPLVSALVGLGLGAIVVYPPVFSFLLNRALRLFKQEPLIYTLSFGRALVLLFAYVLAWILYGTSFWLMLKGIGLENPPFWSMVAASGAAYLLGFLALFAPGGLGVREGVLLVLISPYVPAGLAAMVAVVARIWITVVELLGLLPVLRGVSRPIPEQPGSPESEEPKRG